MIAHDIKKRSVITKCSSRKRPLRTMRPFISVPWSLFLILRNTNAPDIQSTTHLITSSQELATSSVLVFLSTLDTIYYVLFLLTLSICCCTCVILFYCLMSLSYDKALLQSKINVQKHQMNQSQSANAMEFDNENRSPVRIVALKSPPPEPSLTISASHSHDSDRDVLRNLIQSIPTQTPQDEGSPNSVAIDGEHRRESTSRMLQFKRRNIQEELMYPARHAAIDILRYKAHDVEEEEVKEIQLTNIETDAPETSNTYNTVIRYDTPDTTPTFSPRFLVNEVAKSPTKNLFALQCASIYPIPQSQEVQPEQRASMDTSHVSLSDVTSADTITINTARASRASSKGLTKASIPLPPNMNRLSDQNMADGHAARGNMNPLVMSSFDEHNQMQYDKMVQRSMTRLKFAMKRLNANEAQNHEQNKDKTSLSDHEERSISDTGITATVTGVSGFGASILGHMFGDNDRVMNDGVILHR
eukprot:216852_1